MNDAGIHDPTRHRDARRREPRPTTRRRRLGRRLTTRAVLFPLAAGSPHTTTAQTLTGTVLDDESGQPVAIASVRLVAPDEGPLSVVLSDSLGRFRIDAGRPGRYRLEVSRLGYQDFTTPLVEVAKPEGIYPLDVVLRPVPVAVQGVTVTAERRAEIERQVRLLVGVSVSSLRAAPFERATLLEHAKLGRDVASLLRWEPRSNIVVKDSGCIALGAGGCLPIYLDGVRLLPEFLPLYPLDQLETVVVLHEGESLAYGGGAVLLYTPGWIR